MSDIDPLAYLELSMQLQYPTEPKVFCGAYVTHPKTGYRVATCSFEMGHDNKHVDVHSGATWQ